MSNKDLTFYLRCKLFGTRSSIDEAYEYAMDLLGRDVQTLTALHVLMNAIADQIEEN